MKTLLYTKLCQMQLHYVTSLERRDLLSRRWLLHLLNFLVAPSLRAERLIWSLWRVSVWLVGWLFVSHRPPPPPAPEIIGSQKFQNQNLFQLILSNFSRGDPPPPVKGKNFDTGFGLIHVQTGKKNFSNKIF